MPKKSPKKKASKAAAKTARPPLLRGVLRRLFGLLREDLPATDYLEGKPDTPVVEVEQFQAALAALCGGRTAKAQKVATTALLRPHQSGEAADVLIDGKLVGALKPADAKRLTKQLEKAGVWPCALRVNALILGGRRKRTGEEEPFAVLVSLPPRPKKPKRVEFEDEDAPSEG